jgi:hypothetical protein
MIIDNQDNDLGFIKINLDKFINIYNQKKDDIINENLNKKVNDLINNYNCFASNYDAKSLWEKKKIIASQKKSKNNNTNINNNNFRNKPRVLLNNLDFSDENKCKKEFTSYLNKLTDLNKEIIYKKISNFLSQLNDKILKSLFDVLINFIKISSNNIYIDVLFLFNNNNINDYINNFCINYINNREWLSKDIIIDYKILYDNNNYDLFCSYVKIKKTSLSLLKALIIILKKLNNINFIENILNEIFIDINSYIKNNNYKHIIELLLDELIIILEFLPNKDIINNIQNFDISNFEYSTKFKIMKILDNIR